MGILDFLFDKEQAEKRRLAKMQKTVTNMYVQATERQFVLSELKEINTEDALKVLLARFKENSHNSTVDLEEKEYVFDAVIEMAKYTPEHIPVIRAHIVQTPTHINWPLKILGELYDENQMADLLREMLSTEKTEYQRDPEKKQEVILRASEFRNEDLAKEVARFLEDANETVRFMAVETLIAMNFDSCVPALEALVADEDSLRISQRIQDYLKSR